MCLHGLGEINSIELNGQFLIACYGTLKKWWIVNFSSCITHYMKRNIHPYAWMNQPPVCLCVFQWGQFWKSLMSTTRVPWDGSDPEVKEIWEWSTYTTLYESMWENTMKATLCIAMIVIMQIIFVVKSVQIVYSRNYTCFKVLWYKMLINKYTKMTTKYFNFT